MRIALAQINPTIRKASEHPVTSGSTATAVRHRAPLARAVRSVGIMLDTAARVVFLGRDGVKL